MNPLYYNLGRQAPDPNWVLPAHYHPFHELVVLVQGKMTVKIRDQKIMARSGDVLFYPKGVPHEEWSNPDDPVESLFLGFEWDIESINMPLITHDDNGRLRTLFGWIYADRDSEQAYSISTPMALCQIILAEIQRLSVLKEHRLVTTIRSHMREHLEEPLTLENLAEFASMSKYYFLRTYKQLTGRTPMEDLRRIRLEAARNMIITTNLPLKVIAPKTGLGDEYHLSHMFRRYLQTTPSELRRELNTILIGQQGQPDEEAYPHMMT